MNEQIGVGIIGCGAISIAHAENFSQMRNVELIATADVDAERARALAQRFKVKAWYSDHKILLERQDIQAVSICLPPYLHAIIGVDAAKSGKHILVEKPIAINLKEADMLIRAARKAHVKLGVAYEYRFNKAVQFIYKTIKSEEIGKLILGNLSVKQYRSDEYYLGDGWRSKWSMAGGGVVMSNAIHWLDLLQWFFGPVEEVYGQIDTSTHRIEVEDVCGAIIRFKNRAIGIFVASNSIKPGFPARMEIHGDGGSMVLEGNIERLHAKLLATTGIVKKECISKQLPKIDTPPFVPSEGHKPLIKDFLNAIVTDSEPAVTGEEGRKSLEITAAIYNSAKCRKTIKLPSREWKG